MSIVFFETLNSLQSRTSGEVFFTFDKGLYDIWLIGRGGDGGYKGENWGLYVGAGGTSGSGGGVVRIRMYNSIIAQENPEYLTTIKFFNEATDNYDCMCEIWSVDFINSTSNVLWSRFGVKNGSPGVQGGSAWAFDATPDKADPPNGGTYYIQSDVADSNLNKSNMLFYTANGPNGTNLGGRTEGSPALSYDVSALGPDGGKYLTPTYIAGAAQNGYSDVDSSDGTLCLGQPGGGQGEDDGGIGYGGDGGIIIEKINKSVVCDIYRGTELLNGLYLGSNGITPYVYI